MAAPPIALAAVATFRFANAERARLEAVVDQANADVSRTIDASLHSTVAMLQALATSPNLKTGDFEAFDAQARVMTDLQKVTIVLTDPDRRQFVNTAAPFGGPLPRSNDNEPADFGPDGRQPYVSNLFTGALTGKKLLRVVLPVHQNDRLIYELSATIDPADLSRTLRESLEAGPYFATVLDRNGIIVGRSIAPEEFVGKPLRGLADSARVGAHGLWEGVNPQGIPIFVYWRRPAVSNWVVATGISQGALRAPLNKSLLILGVLTLGFIGVAGVCAGWIARKITRAHGSLVALAGKLSANQALEAPQTPLSEANLVGRAIESASRLLARQGTEIARAQKNLKRRIEQRTRDLNLKTVLLETTLENMDQGLVVVNDDGKVAICNRRAWELLDAGGRAPHTPEHAGKLLSLLKRDVATVEPKNGRTPAYEVEHADGTWLEVRANPVPYGGTIYTLADVTSSRRHAKELRIAKESAERASRAKSELLATMSHEIRTPLNSVLGSADLLAEDADLPPGHRKLVRRILKAGGALTTMMEDVLDLANIEAGRFKVRPRRFALADLLDDVRSLTIEAFALKDLTLSIAVEHGLPEYFEGDDSRLRQVLLNYVNNAIKFSFTGVVELAVSGSRVESGQWTMRFAVTDTGIGVSKEKQKHIFKQFAQADRSIERRFGGSGLGLSICKRLIEAMGGEVGIESEPGTGSTLWFNLLLPQAAGPSLKDDAPVEILQDCPRAKILVAEDVPVNQDVARELLESLGHTVEVVSSGEEAVAAVQKQPFDLVLMDIFMPGLDGLEATRVIRKLDHPARLLPIVACTANALPTQVSQYKRAGLDGFLAKPLRRADLRCIVERFALSNVEHAENSQRSRESNGQGREIYTADKLLKLLGPAKTLSAVISFETSLELLLVPLRNNAAEREELARRAHSLLSISSLFGMSSLSIECRKLEVSCRSPSGARRQLTKMRPLINQVKMQLSSLKNEIELGVLHH